MKKFLLCAALLAAFCSYGFSEASSSSDVVFSGNGSGWINDHTVYGILSYGNASEYTIRKLIASRIAYNRLLQDSGYLWLDVDDSFDIRLDGLSANWLKAFVDSIQIKFFDSLNSMLMAFNSGEVDAIFIYSTVADYLAANGHDIYCIAGFSDKVPAEDGKNFLRRRLITNGYHSDELTFLLMAENEKLRDEINTALNDMDKEGVLAKFEAQYLRSQDYAALEAVKPLKFDGADTIKVGVTGDIPPFDYVSEAGVPAGYNTAVLAEIGKRIRKNIEFVNIDAGARAIALSSGAVDVVFWNRVQACFTENGEYVFGEEAMKKEIKALGMNPDKTEKALALIDTIWEFDESVDMDHPEGTIVTRPYHSALSNNIHKKSSRK